MRHLASVAASSSRLLSRPLIKSFSGAAIRNQSLLFVASCAVLLAACGSGGTQTPCTTSAQCKTGERCIASGVCQATDGGAGGGTAGGAGGGTAGGAGGGTAGGAGGGTAGGAGGGTAGGAGG
ncbi:MAG: hypothetical protein H6Q89_4885, partial [Myxococcaceae bacterium]|nr:hypothetical protein [Myxococcaceae bacterium]